MSALTSERSSQHSPRRSSPDDSDRSDAMRRVSTVFSSRVSDPEDAMYHMGTYGTLDMGTNRAHLFELQVYVDSLQFHALSYFVFVIVGMTLWPIAGLLVLPLKLIARTDRVLQRCKLIFVLASIFGYILNAIPLYLVGYAGGFSRFYELYVLKQEMHSGDFMETMLSGYILLLIVAFACMYSDITGDCEKYKDFTKQSWIRRRDEHGLFVEMPKVQFERVKAALGPEKLLSTPDASARVTSDHMCVSIADMLCILEMLPGWSSDVSDLEVRFQNTHNIGTGIFDDLHSLSLEAQQQNLWPIDIWLVETQWYSQSADDSIRLWPNILHAYRSTLALMSAVFEHFLFFKPRFVLFAILSALRAILPQIWAFYVYGETMPAVKFWGPVQIIRLYSTLLSFAVGLFWMGLFLFVFMEYRRSLAQVMSFTALVDAQSRAEYSEYYLLSYSWYFLNPQQSKEVLAKMPLLDLRMSNNVSAFCRLWEYVALDRSSERMAIIVLTEIVVIYIVVKFSATVLVLYSTASLPPVTVVTVFDLVVIGGMVMLGLQTAMQMARIMESHKEILAQARYMVGEKTAALERGSNQMRDCKEASRLLLECLDMLREKDLTDPILFGLTMTPTKLASSAITLASMIWVVLAKMVNSGQIKAPVAVKEHLEEVVDDHVINEMAIAAWAHAVNLFSMSTSILHSKWHAE